MKEALLSLPVLLIITMTVHSQKIMYIGIEGGITHDVYDQVDDGASVKKGVLITACYGVTVARDISEKAFTEISISRKHYDEGIGFTNSPGFTSTNAFDALSVGVRLGARINLSKEKIHLVPVIGYCRVYPGLGYGDADLSGFTITSTDTITYNVHSKMDLGGPFPLIQTGIGVQFNIRRTLLLSFSANYFTGFLNVIEQDIEYTHNGSAYTAKGLSKGEYFALSFGVKYPFSASLRKKSK